MECNQQLSSNTLEAKQPIGIEQSKEMRVNRGQQMELGLMLYLSPPIPSYIYKREIVLLCMHGGIEFPCNNRNLTTEAAPV